MHPITVSSIAVAVGMVFFPFAVVQGAVDQKAASFLKQTVEANQAEIALGELAVQRAVNDRVKEFGSQMIEDHKRLNQELEPLAYKKGVKVASQLTAAHKRKVEELSKLSGHPFDRAYMQSILINHEEDVKEFEKAQALNDPDVKMWASSTLPTLEDHRKNAVLVRNALQTNPEK
jgi:putative membrane protein